MRDRNLEALVTTRAGIVMIGWRIVRYFSILKRIDILSQPGRSRLE